MKYVILGVILSIALMQCKSDKATTHTDVDAIDTIVNSTQIPEEVIEQVGNELFAKIDRLKIRTDSTMRARTATVISEGDTLIYMGAYSQQRENLKLRGQYYHEPWIKVNHPKSGKSGWVYAGAVKYDDPRLKTQLQNASPLMAQVYADDLEWEGNVPTSWSTASFSNAASFKVFLIKFKELVAKGEIDALSKYIKYPIKNINSPAEFKDYYPRIFNETMKGIVAEQRLDRIFRNAYGAMIGNSDITFRQVDGDYKIVAINFKGREDIKKELMASLSNTFVGADGDRKYSIKAFTIKGFLELTLNYQANGYPQSRSLGRYLFESSQAGQHRFIQDTRDSTKAILIYTKANEQVDLRIQGIIDPNLEGVLFSMAAD